VATPLFSTIEMTSLKESHTDVFNKYIQKRINAAVRTIIYKMNKDIRLLKEEIEVKNQKISVLEVKLNEKNPEHTTTQKYISPTKPLNEFPGLSKLREIVVIENGKPSDENTIDYENTCVSGTTSHDEKLFTESDRENVVENEALVNEPEADDDHVEGSENTVEENINITENDEYSVYEYDNTKSKDNVVEYDVEYEDNENIRENECDEDNSDEYENDEECTTPETDISRSKDPQDMSTGNQKNQKNQKEKVTSKIPFKNITNLKEEVKENSYSPDHKGFYNNFGDKVIKAVFFHDPGSHPGLKRIVQVIPLQTIACIIQSIQNRIEENNCIPSDNWIRKSIGNKVKNYEIRSKTFQYFLHFTIIYHALMVNKLADVNLRPVEHQMNGTYINVRSLIKPNKKIPKTTMSSLRAKSKRKPILKN